MVPQRLTVVVPALNEAAGIRRCLEGLAPLRARGHEVIVVDGGSADGTRPLAAMLADRVLEAPRGRARQMNAGAAAAAGDALLFLHADTLLPEGA
ncbi:MAG: glycosyltransferase, partial [Burkholderiales bacterium]